MRIGRNSGIVVGQGGKITGGATVNNVIGAEKVDMNKNFYGPVGVVADEAHDFEVNQDNRSTGNLDLPSLVGELAKLRVAARQQATEGEHDISVAEIALAESAAKNNDEKTVLEHLKKAGQWALDIATKIGTSIAVEAIKKAIFP